MSRLSLAAHPFVLGFEELEKRVERTARAGADGYPPFNIEQRGPDAYRITLAVAGFSASDLTITVEENTLTIRGRQAEDVNERVFLHRGIAGRAFERSFVLADRVEVAGAHLEAGLLHVDLARQAADTSVRRIPIATGKGGGDV